VDEPGKRWVYEPDERPKRKHHWDRPHAGFVKVRGMWVGKCPNDVSIEEAEHLLNQGLQLPLGQATDAPRRICIIHRQILYRATPTNPGRSYHAFPERPVEIRQLPRAEREAILQLAERQGCRATIEQWLRR
jgi:hypothetical protein